MLLRTTRTAGLVGSAIGVMVGCLIGMFPLFFMPDPEMMEAVKRKEKVREILRRRSVWLFVMTDFLESGCTGRVAPRCWYAGSLSFSFRRYFRSDTNTRSRHRQY